MPRLFHRPLICACLAAMGTAAWCSPDIETEKTSAGPVYYLVDKEVSKNRTLVWNPQEAKSDCGYFAGGDVTPEFFWSPDRDYLAVNGGSPKDRQVFLYRVAKGKLSSADVVPFTLAQSAALRKLKGDFAASGTDVVRWLPEGNLLIHVWAEERVADEKQKPGSANFWAELAMDGNRAKPVSVSDSEPEKAESATGPSAHQLDPAQIAGTHTCKGTNPDGSKYEGTVTFRVKRGLVLIEWDIDGKTSHGTGLIEGMTLGVALDDGLAIYHIFPQAEGFSLIGRWAAEGAEEASGEVILAGQGDMEKAKIPASIMNGSYDWVRESSGGSQEEGTAKISGGDVSKTVRWNLGKKVIPGQGLALGDGLAVIRPDGLAVYQLLEDDENHPYLAGRSLRPPATISQETLKPENQ
jgi:hypothetical protein